MGEGLAWGFKLPVSGVVLVDSVGEFTAVSVVFVEVYVCVFGGLFCVFETDGCDVCATVFVADVEAYINAWAVSEFVYDSGAA